MWFSAKLQHQTNGEERGEDVLIDETIWVIEADSLEQATQEAQRLGIEAEHSYLNHLDETVEWSFVKILEVQDLSLETLKSGAEVYSELRWKDSIRVLKK